MEGFFMAKEQDQLQQKAIFKLFFTVAMRYKVRTLIAIFGAAITAIIGGFVGPFLISRLLEALQSGSVELASSTGLILLYAATQIWGEVIGWRINLYVTWTMETAAQRDLYRKIFTQLTNQSLSFHADRFGGALVSQTTKLIGAFERFWDTIIFQVIPSLASIVAATIILGLVFPQYAIFLASLSVVFAIAVFFRR